MKRILSLAFGLLFFQTTFPNINSIDFSKVKFTTEVKDDLDFIINNQTWFNHWSPTWIYDEPKNKCLKRLKSVAGVCKKAKSYEEYLLKGVIAHFRYNLADENQFKVSVKAYREAIKINPTEFRAYWYLGNHFAHSAVQDSSVKYFLIAESMGNDITDSEFWEEYAFAFQLANMPSHCIYGMEKSNAILGELGYFDQVLGKTVRDRLVVPDPSAKYEVEDLWSYQEEGEMSTFISRALGLKFSVDSTWNLNFGKYTNRTSYIMITPNAETNNEGREVTYSILVMMHNPEEGETIDGYSSKMVGKYPDKKSHDQFNSMNPNLSYEIKDTSMYTDLGGGHLQFMGITKNYPKYPGLELEIPVKIPEGKKKKLAYYRLNSTFNRFEGDIFYVVMLDTYEDIYEKSLKVYEVFLENLIIE
ncbi:MAG: hypothetical protein JKY33_08480 [Bacteroidia bacterium]|nr:hypothetical protein [Bacteroidia bacterium]